MQNATQMKAIQNTAAIEIGHERFVEVEQSSYQPFCIYDAQGNEHSYDQNNLWG